MDQTKNTSSTFAELVNKPKTSKAAQIAPLLWFFSLVTAALNPLFVKLGLPAWLLFLSLVLPIIISCPSAWITLWSWRHWLGSISGFGLSVSLFYLFFTLNTWLSSQIDGLFVKTAQSVLALLMLNLMLGGLGILAFEWAWRKHAAWLLLGIVGLCVQWGMLITRVWFSPDQLIDAWFNRAPQLLNLTPLMCSATWMFAAGLGAAFLEILKGIKRELS